MPLDRAVMDFHKVGLVDTPEGQRLRVVVVVTEREGVDLLLDTLRRAGLKPEGIDLSIFSVIRSLSHHDESDSGPVLYAQLGDLVNIAIAESGVCRFTRQAPQGLAMVLGRLAENRSIPLDAAHELLYGETDEELDEGDVPVADLLARTALELGAELRAAAEFYSTQFGPDVVTTGVVAGPLAPLPGFVEALSAASGLELTCGEVIAGDDERPRRRRRADRAGGHRPRGGSPRVMNAVNLIPADHRRRSTSVSASPVTLGVIGSLVVVLAAAVLYVFTVNDVRARRSELARVTANAASWQAAANSYTSYVTAAAQRKQQMADVHQLVSGRFPWSLLLSQIGGVMPANAALSNLSAASPSADSTAVAAAASGTTSSTASTNTSAVRSAGARRRSRRSQRRWWPSAACRESDRSTSPPRPTTGRPPVRPRARTAADARSRSRSRCRSSWCRRPPARRPRSSTSGSTTPAGGSATTPTATPTASAATSTTGAAQ